MEVYHKKAQSQELLIVAADTIVVLEAEIMEKPKDSAEALQMLMKLNGRKHEVITGVALAWKEEGAALQGSSEEKVVAPGTPSPVQKRRKVNRSDSAKANMRIFTFFETTEVHFAKMQVLRILLPFLLCIYGE